MQCGEHGVIFLRNGYLNKVIVTAFGLNKMHAMWMEWPLTCFEPVRLVKTGANSRDMAWWIG